MTYERGSKTDLHHQKRERARCSNHDALLLHSSLNVGFLRAAIEPWTWRCRVARGDKVRCAVRIVGIGFAIVGLISRLARIRPSVERANGSEDREKPGDNEDEPKEEVAANIRAWMYRVGSGQQDADVGKTPYKGE